MFLSLTTGYSGVESILKLVGLIILCVVIIAASYYVTKLIGRREAGYSGNSNFKAIDAFRLSPNKYLQLIQVGDRYFVIAVCKDDVSLICEVDREDIRIASQPSGKFSFKDVMSKAIGRKKNSGPDDLMEGEIIPDEEAGAPEEAPDPKNAPDQENVRDSEETGDV